MKTFYEVLGITKNASLEEITKAYRKASLKTHPDRQGGSSEKFIEVQSAYDTLSDPVKRKKYDQALESPIQDENLIRKFYYSSLEDVYEQIPELIKVYEKKLKVANDIQTLYCEYSFIQLMNNIISTKQLARALSHIPQNAYKTNVSIPQDVRKNPISKDPEKAVKDDLALMKKNEKNTKKLRELVEKFENKFSKLTQKKTDELAKRLIEAIRSAVSDKLKKQGKQLFIQTNEDYLKNYRKITGYSAIVTLKFSPLSVSIHAPVDLEKDISEAVSNNSVDGQYFTRDFDSYSYRSEYSVDINFKIDIGCFTEKTVENETLRIGDKTSKEEDVETTDVSKPISQITSTTATLPSPSVDTATSTLNIVNSTSDSPPKPNAKTYQDKLKQITTKILNCNYHLHGGRGKKINGADYSDATIPTKFISTGAYESLKITYSFSQKVDLTEKEMRKATQMIYEHLKDKRNTHLGFFGFARRDQETVKLYKDILKDLEGFYQEKTPEPGYASACVPPRC